MEAAQRLRQRVGKFQPTKMGHFRPTLTITAMCDETVPRRTGKVNRDHNHTIEQPKSYAMIIPT